MAFTARAIRSEDMSRMNVENDVSSRLKTTLGIEATRGRVQAVDQVGRDQRAEEHAVRGEEGPHEELLVRNARRGGVVVMVVDGDRWPRGCSLKK
jgi:hypothetical protein